MVKRLSLAMVLALAVCIAGCASRQTEPPSEAARVRLLYQSKGTLIAVKVFGPVAREQVLVWEGFGQNDDPMESEGLEPRGVLRSFVLDPATGQTQDKWEHASSDAVWSWSNDYLALSQDGTRFAQLGFDPLAEGSKVWVADVGGEWTSVRPFDTQFRALPLWSPNGDVLAYLTFYFGGSEGMAGRKAVALSVPRPAGIAKETVLTPDGHASDELAWAPDSRRVYLISVEPDVGPYLEALEWPSRERRKLFEAAWIGHLSVAREAGDVVFLAAKESSSPEAAEGDSAQRVWRLSPDGGVEKTPVTHAGALPPHVISPDGSRLAVVPSSEEGRYGQGLMVYSMQDGTAETFAELEGKFILDIDWVLGGRAVLAIDGEERIWLAAVKGDLPEIAPVDLEPPLISNFPPDTEQQSRNNLRKLAQALHTYVADHDCVFPDLSDREAVAAALAPYLEDEDVFLDPRTREPYGANIPFSGECDLDHPQVFDLVVFYETTPGEDGGRNVASLFGAAHHVSDERWQQIKKLSGIE